MREYLFNVEAARRYGVDAAIFLHSLAFWVEKNRANSRHFHAGRYWSYNTQKALAELFPFWTRRQIERIITHCKDEGALLTGRWSEDQTDRTTWYALSDEAMRFYAAETVECIAPNGEMHSTKCGDGLHQTVECNKEQLLTQLDNTPHTPQGGRRRKESKTVPVWKPERFARFWAFYAHNARGEKRQTAIQAWDKLKADDALIAVMGQALMRQVCSDDWRRGVGIPYAATWLNQRRWEDVPKLEETDTTGGWADDPEVI